MPAITPRNFWSWFGGTWLGIGLLFLAIGIGVALHAQLRAGRLDRDGRAVEGIVLVKEIRTGDPGPTYHVRYRFEPAGEVPIEGSAEIDRAAWSDLAERGPIAITAIPGDPRVHRAAGARSDPLLAVIFACLGAIGTALGGIALRHAISARRAERALDERGEVASGTVIELAPARIRIRGERQWRVRYRFSDAAGRVREGGTTISPEAAAALRVGDIGRVVHDPERPGRSLWRGRG